MPFSEFQQKISDCITKTLTSFGSINKKCKELKNGFESSENFLFLDQIVQSLKWPLYFLCKNLTRIHEVLLNRSSVTNFFPGLYGATNKKIEKECDKLMRGLNSPYQFLEEIHLLYRKIFNRAGIYHQSRFEIQNAVTNVSNILVCIKLCINN
jgi:hypothetical protein